MEHYYKDVPGWFATGELYDMMTEKYNDAKFVEIGCWKGRSTSYMGVSILNTGKNIKLDVVDTFKGSYEHGEINSEKLYNEFCKNVKPIWDVIGTVHRMTSLEAAALYPDNSLDFVFIDASHDYANVIADINAWYPKIKIGGTLGGDDYCDGWPGVMKAVNEIFGAANISIAGGQHWYICKT